MVWYPTPPALGALALALTLPSDPWQLSPGIRTVAVAVWKKVQARATVNGGGEECCALASRASEMEPSASRAVGI